MREESKKYLDDIGNAIELIEVFMVGINDFSSYQQDLKTKSAVERKLGIIGEAAGKLLKSDSTIQLNSVNQIISLRNRIIHAYDSIDDSIVWAIWKNHLSNLKSEVQNYLNKNPE